ncbi:hypothetical protein [Dyadobacter aurulentus]|uniref:hypothetical protein n=1 Tax=Dyadobacter sp. UC 10 TaxID=2605428 RepID=UPI0011F351B0|nr:hypothetical protein [Dyadobacter sp. UC 10]KAA0990191.1 hypothetical protein FXO21_08485 [Dyadobacter sp. UC 10]
MKKHPVDDLFKRKLGDLEKKPSENAWLRIQAENKPKHRSLGWIWYAAASLVVGLFGGYLVWKNSQSGLDAPIPNKVIAKVEAAEPPAKSIETESISESIDTLSRRNIQKGSLLTDNVTKYPQQSKKVKTEQSVKDDRILVEIIEKPVAIVSQNALAEVSQMPEVSEHNPEHPVTETIKPEAEPARTIVVAVESEFNETDDKPKTSRFSRVFRQLKNARAGERVDWEEVGFNPKTLVARVDDRLRSKDDKVSENQNPKDRTKL